MNSFSILVPNEEVADVLPALVSTGGMPQIVQQEYSTIKGQSETKPGSFPNFKLTFNELTEIAFNAVGFIANISAIVLAIIELRKYRKAKESKEIANDDNASQQRPLIVIVNNYDIIIDEHKSVEQIEKEILEKIKKEDSASK